MFRYFLHHFEILLVISFFFILLKWSKKWKGFILNLYRDLSMVETVHYRIFLAWCKIHWILISTNRCEERSRALELCSWGFENEAVLTSFLAQLENAGNYTRAAAVAVFNQRIKQAIQILQKGAAVKEPTLNSTAMALSGMWLKCEGLIHHLYYLHYFQLAV